VPAAAVKSWVLPTFGFLPGIKAFREKPERFWRIGTGEFTDSLAIDRLTRLSSVLVPFMANQTNAVLELKTKSAEVHPLRAEG